MGVDDRIPGFLGCVLDGDDEPVGTCFQVDPDVVVTARHVLASLDADDPGAKVRIAPLRGGPAAIAHVLAVHQVQDLALLRPEAPLPATVRGLRPSDGIELRAPVLVTGVSQVDDRHAYAYLDAPGAWSGGTIRDNAPLGRLRSGDVTRGMSGAPVLVDREYVAGVVSGRYNSADGWLRDTVWVARTEDLAELLGRPFLTRPGSGRLGARVPPLPRNFIPRRADLDAIVAAVVAPGDGPVVVHGMPGVGKTVLASAVARDERIRRKFVDGVIWLALGREHTMLRSLAVLAEELGAPGSFADVEEGTARLRELLAQRSCLVVLDDVWDTDDLGAFDVLGPDGRLLVTSRDSRVGVPLAGVEHAVGVLPPDLALRLLTAWSGNDSDLARAREVVQECGRLPLALAMIGAMVRGRGDRWNSVLARLRAADLGSVRQRFPGYPFDSLLATIQVSVDALPGTGMAERFLDFALFPADVAVPEAVVCGLWEADGMSTYQAQDDLDLLVDRSLVLRATDGALTLHDLLVDYVTVMSARRGISDRRHRDLLASYWARCPNDWPSGPDDGYFFPQLARHLVAAGRVDELHRLLRLTDSDGRHGWYESARSRGDLAGFLSDIDTAWTLAEHAGDVGLQVRYALITASVNSIAGATPPQLLRAAVEHGLRTVDDAFTDIGRMPEPTQRAAAVGALAPLLPTELLDDALAVVDAVPDGSGRAKAVEALAARLIEIGRVADGLAAAASLADPMRHGVALAATAPHRAESAAEAVSLAASLKRRAADDVLTAVALRLDECGLPAPAVAAAQRIESADARDAVLARLATHLPADVAAELIERAAGRKRRAEQVRLLVDLLPVLSEPQVRALLRAVPDLKDRSKEAPAYIAVAARLQEPERNGVLGQALHRALGVKSSWVRSRVVAEVAPHLPEPLVREALERVGTWRADRILAQGALAARLAALGYVDEALELARNADGAERTPLLDAIARHLPTELLAVAIGQAREIGDRSLRIEVMIRLLPHLTEPRRIQQVAAVIHEERGTPGWVPRAMAVAAHLPTSDRAPWLETATAEVMAIPGWSPEHLAALTSIAPHRPHDAIEALAECLHKIDPFSAAWLVEPLSSLLAALGASGQAETAAALVRSAWPKPPARPRTDALDPLSRFDEEHASAASPLRALLTSVLLPHLPHAMQTVLGTEALASISAVSSSSWLFGLGGLDWSSAPEDRLLAAVINALPPELLDDATEIVATKADQRSEPLPEANLALAVRRGAGLATAVDSALLLGTDDGRAAPRSTVDPNGAIILNMPGGYLPMFALARIAQHLPRGAVEHVLDLRAPGQSAERERRAAFLWPPPQLDAHDAVLAALAVRLAEVGDPTRALNLTLELPHSRTRAVALTRIADLSVDAVADAVSGPPGSHRLLRVLANQARDDLLLDLSALAPALARLGGDDAASAMHDALVDIGTWWP